MMTLIITLLLLISHFVAFLLGVVSELTQDIYSRVINLNPQQQRLNKIWNKYDEVCNTLFVMQLFIMLLTVFIIGNTKDFISLSLADALIPSIALSILLIVVIILITFVTYFIGKRFCERTIGSLATAINIITAPFLPIITKTNLFYLRLSGKENDDVGMEEITDIVEEAREDGSIDAGEYRILKNVMQFTGVLVSDVMTPRVVLFSCRADMTVGETAKLPELQIYSRFPIWNGESIDDDVIGYVTTKEVFNACLNNLNGKPLSELARPINFIPENAELGTTLEEFLLNKQQLYLVVDEYGGIEGIITMEDILETMLGVEIVDEADKIVDLRILAKSKREIRIKDNVNMFIE